MICETGGEVCLDAWWYIWVEKHSETFIKVTVTINNVEQHFTISSTGKVVRDIDLFIICETGG